MGRRGKYIRCSRCGMLGVGIIWFRHKCDPTQKLVVPSKSEKEAMTPEEREEYEEKLKAAVLRGPVMVKLVGAAQVTTFRAPKSNGTWATKKKPKG